MKFIKKLCLFALLATILTSCCKDDVDDVPVTITEINDFIWRGMNTYYLYKDNINDLRNDRPKNQPEYLNFLNSFSSPINFFENLIYQRQTVDRFSWIVEDYVALERLFQGTVTTTGMEYNFYETTPNSNEIFGVIRLVLPGSPADLSGLKRGDIFYGIDNTTLTKQNRTALTNRSSFTLNLGVFNENDPFNDTDDTIDPSKDITITKVEYTENPVFKTNILEVNGEKVGYLMYNGFTSGSENDLNTVFADFKSNAINHLVLDVRYNPGGALSTTTFLASMITGQFNTMLFEKLVFNKDLEKTENRLFNFTNKLSNGEDIVSLGLTKLYVLASGSSASASEAIINGLKPYINVIQIGTNTVGKNQASITRYDSPNFTKNNVNPKHFYAMQPLVADGANKNEEKVPSSGLTPSIGFEYRESPTNYGVLGDKNEPMLAIALADIAGESARVSRIKSKTKKEFKLLKAKDRNPLEGGMIIK